MRTNHMGSRSSWLLLIILAGCSRDDWTPMAASPNAASGSGGSGAPATTGTTGTSTAGVPATTTGPSAGRAAVSGSGGSRATAGQPAAGASQPDKDLDDAGTADAATQPDAAAAAPRSTGPGDWVAGDYPPDITSANWREIKDLPGQNGNVRQYKVHIPPGYKPEVPSPVVFCIHGLGQDALLFCVTGTEMNKKSDAGNFVLIMPNGYQNSWNAGTCCGAASTEELDDVALFRAIFKEVGEHVNIDLNRVYATGLSNGGYMSYRLACEAADIFRGVAPAAGAIGINDIGGGTNPSSNFTACKPSRPVSLLDIHGTDDPLIPYSLQKPTLDLLVKAYGCQSTTMPAKQPMSGGDTTCVTYAGCPAGIELTACSVDKGGHCWFGSPDCGTGGGDIGLAIVGNNSTTLKNTDVIWEFFTRNAQ